MHNGRGVSAGLFCGNRSSRCWKRIKADALICVDYKHNDKYYCAISKTTNINAYFCVMITERDNIYAALSCDIVDSTSLTESGIFELRDKIEECFHDIQFYGYEFWGRVVKGDYIECLFKNPKEVLRAALALKCYIKYIMYDFGASLAAVRYGMRSSIGIGSMRIVNEKRDIMDGEAIYCAGRNLSLLSKRQFAVADVRTVEKNMSDILSMNYILIDEWINEISPKQAIVVYHKLLGMSEVGIANLYNLSQPAVNLRSKSAKWDMIEERHINI